MRLVLVWLGSCTKYISPIVQMAIQLAKCWSHTFNQLKTLGLLAKRSITTVDLENLTCHR